MTRYFLALGLFFASFQVDAAQLPLDQQEIIGPQGLRAFCLERIKSVISQTLDFKDGKYTYKDISDERFDGIANKL